MALATIENVETRLGRCFESKETPRVKALIEDVSANIEGEIGYRLSSGPLVESSCPSGATLKLCHPMVTEVTSVVDAAGDPVGFSWVAGSPSVTFDELRDGSPVTVSYVAGWADPPQDLLALTCQVVGRALGVSPEDTGTQQETLASYSYSIGSAAASGPLGLLAAEQRIIQRYQDLLAGPGDGMVGQVHVGNWLDRLVI